jgi:uncharacterized protein (DUF4415 family)
MARKSTESFQREKLVRMNAAAMRKPLTRTQRREIKALAAKPDSEIDFSDIPETVGKLYKPIKRAISLRIDADVLAWLQSTPGYQMRINQLLREAMRQASNRDHQR